MTDRFDHTVYSHAICEFQRLLNRINLMDIDGVIRAQLFCYFQSERLEIGYDRQTRASAVTKNIQNGKPELACA